MLAADLKRLKRVENDMLPESVKTLTDVFLWRCEQSANKEAYCVKANGRWVSKCWSEYRDDVFATAVELHHLGIRRGDRIAILGDTCPEWAEIDVAALLLGAATVGIYPTLPTDQVRFILEDSRARMLFVRGSQALPTLRSLITAVPSLEFRAVWACTPADLRSDEISLDALKNSGRHKITQDGGLVPRLAREVREDDIATIVYTSGTTGDPKGVPLTHRNCVSVFRSGQQLFAEQMTEEDITIAFMPMAHIAEHLGCFGRMAIGIKTAYATSYETVHADLVEIRPTYLGGPPRMFEKMYGRILSEVGKRGPVQQRLFRAAEQLARRRARALQHGRPLGWCDRVLLPIVDHLIFRRIRARLGSRIKMFTSGAAPIAIDLLEFFWGIGLPIYEVYGLSESAGLAFANTARNWRLGTVGRAIPGMDFKIATDGEILLKGPSLFSGYLNRTKDDKTFDQAGYLRTGDIGRVDEEGFLRITDRKKHLLKTAGGKFVAPARVEAAVKQQDELISNVFVEGDGKPYVVALITLDFEHAGPRTAQELGIAFHTLTAEPTVRRRIDLAVRAANDKLARYEQIKKYTILPIDFSTRDRTITPTLKINRPLVARRYAEEIAALYGHYRTG